MIRLIAAGLVMLSVLVPATTQAACAWVLWVVYGDGSGGIEATRDTLKLCQQVLRVEATRKVETLTSAGFKKPLISPNDESHQHLTFVHPDSSIPEAARVMSIRLQCLPDSLPRPRKA